MKFIIILKIMWPSRRKLTLWHKNTNMSKLYIALTLLYLLVLVALQSAMLLYPCMLQLKGNSTITSRTGYNNTCIDEKESWKLVVDKENISEIESESTCIIMRDVKSSITSDKTTSIYF